MVDEHFPQLASWKVTLIGSDINESVLERARRGHYGRMEVSRGMPGPLLAHVVFMRNVDDTFHRLPAERTACYRLSAET